MPVQPHYRVCNHVITVQMERTRMRQKDLNQSMMKGTKIRYNLERYVLNHQTNLPPMHPPRLLTLLLLDLRRKKPIRQHSKRGDEFQRRHNMRSSHHLFLPYSGPFRTRQRRSLRLSASFHPDLYPHLHQELCNLQSAKSPSCPKKRSCIPQSL